MKSYKTVLITGAGGFIGLEIAKEFAKHHWNIIAVIHKKYPEELKKINLYQLIQADLTQDDISTQLSEKPDVVVHVAGLASDIGTDKQFKKLNFDTVQKTIHLGKKYIYISSSDVYGIKDFNGETENKLTYESHPINPYPKYKIKSEKLIQQSLPKNNYVLIRPAAVWGERDKTLEKRFIDFLKYSPFFVFFGKWRGNNRWPLANVATVAKVVYTCSVCSDFDGQGVTIIDKQKTSVKQFYEQLAKQHFPQKKFKYLYLPFWIGCFIGYISTFLSLFCRQTHPIFDPSLYAVYHISSNLDFSDQTQEKILQKYDELTT